MKKSANQTVIKQLIAIGAIGLVSISAANANVTLQVDDNIKVTAINGKEYNSSPFQQIQQTYVLQPGQHVITAKYDRLYELRGDDHDYLRSGNITITAEMQDNQTYRLVMPGQPEKYSEAKKYVKNPTLAVMSGTTVIAQTTDNATDGGLFSGLSGLFGGSDAQMENQRAIAAVNSGQSVNNQHSSNAIAPVAPTTSHTPAATYTPAATSTLDKFMQLWLQATPEERQKIRAWVEE